MRQNQKIVSIVIFLPLPILIFVVVYNNQCCLFGGHLYIERERLSRDIPQSSVIDINLNVAGEKNIDAHQNTRKEMLFSSVHKKKLTEDVNTNCQKHFGIQKTLSKFTAKEKQSLFRHLIVNEEYKFIYCYTPKVACSNWKKVIQMLQGKLTVIDDQTKVDHQGGFKTLFDYTDQQAEVILKEYFKFMFVRHPAKRALSGYRNKFNEIESFYIKHGKKIMDMYHPDEPKDYKGKVPGDDVKFEDFLRYIGVGAKPETLNEHFMPMSILCQPCAINYDFIGTYDNITEDSEYVLRKINAPENVHFPMRQTWYKPTSTNYLYYYYSLISEGILKDFLNTFSLDFTLFNYPKPYFTKPENSFEDKLFNL